MSEHAFLAAILPVELTYKSDLPCTGIVQPGTLVQLWYTFMAPTGSFTRAWVCTFYNEENVHRLRSDASLVAGCCARERGKNDKEHYQIYVRFAQKKRFSWWANQFPGEHVEPRKGSEKQAWQYICDVENYLKEKGAHEKTQGEILWDFGCSKEVESAGDELDQVLDKLEARVPRWQIYREHRRFYFTKGRQIRELDEEMQSWQENGYEFKRHKSA